MQPVKVRDRCVGRQVQGVGLVVAVAELGRAAVEVGGDEDQAVQVHAVALLQVPGEPGGAHRPVRLAAQIFRGHPPAAAGGPEPDDLRDRFDVAPVPVEVLWLLALDHARVPGRHGVDEDEVGVPQQRLVIVGDAVGRREQRAHISAQHPARAEQTQVKPDAGRPRSAVEGERHRPRGRAVAVAVAVAVAEGIGGHEDLGPGLGAVELVLGVAFLAQHDPPGSRGVRELLAVDGDHMVSGDEVVRRVGGLARCSGRSRVRRLLFIRFVAHASAA